MDRHLAEAVRAARVAGDLLRRGFRAAEVLSAEGKDIKTRQDLEAEQRVLEILRPFGLPVLTEETGLHGTRTADDGLLWVIDPLDGTLNYARGLPLCCVSIALWREREPVLGVVHEFLHDRLYAGVVGQGATCNGQPVTVSPVSEVGHAVIATGFPAKASFTTDALTGFVGRVQTYKKVRLLGTAALSLAQVAGGAIDAYAENGIHFWDVAAGLALVSAAGGDFRLGAFDAAWRCDVAATNGRVAIP